MIQKNVSYKMINKRRRNIKDDAKKSYKKSIDNTFYNSVIEQ